MKVEGIVDLYSLLWVITNNIHSGELDGCDFLQQKIAFLFEKWHEENFRELQIIWKMWLAARE